MNSRVTLRDIAEKAGMHFTTVALALRESPRLKVETRQKIQKIAKTMGYRPDPALAALNAYRHSKMSPVYRATLGWVNNWSQKKDLYRFPCFQEYFQGACERAKELGYEIEEFWVQEPGMNLERFQKILKARGIHGLLLAPQPKPHMSLPLNFENYSAVAFGFSMQPSILHVVTNHQARSMRLMLQNLVALGYKRMGLYVSPEWNEKVDEQWVGGLMLAQWKNHQLVSIPPLLHSEGEENLSEIKEWITHHKIDVVISHQGFYQQLMGMGFRIPQDIGFASLDLTSQEKKISGIHQNNVLIGRAAIDCLISALHRNERGIPPVPIRSLVEGFWVEGETLRFKE